MSAGLFDAPAMVTPAGLEVLDAALDLAAHRDAVKAHLDATPYLARTRRWDIAHDRLVAARRVAERRLESALGFYWAEHKAERGW